MRQFRIVTSLDTWSNDSNNLNYTVQMRVRELYFFYSWVDIDDYKELEKAKEALLHLQKPDIYL